MIVDFMIIGAQKCGTTTLFEILARHPALAACAKKEPHFFSTAVDWRAELPRYEALFEAKEGALLFEASTTYTFSPLKKPEVWRRIFEYNPEMKFIYIVRSPLDRIVSSYMHAYERGYTRRPIEKAIVRERIYVDVSRYYTQIRPYLELFGRERLLVLDFDELNGRRAEVMKAVADFLGISYGEFPDFSDVHANRSLGGSKRHYKLDDPPFPLSAVRDLAPPVWDLLARRTRRTFRERPALPPAHQRVILNQLETDIRALEHLLSKDFSHWRNLAERASPSVRRPGPAGPEHTSAGSR